jgi:hypothetical protein
MVLKTILKLIKFDQLTAVQRAALAKILEKRRSELDDAIAALNQALAAKPKAKKSSKK